MTKKVLVVVSHPDDETIWMGGTLLTNKNEWDLTIISLCRKSDKDRAPKFERACRIYNAGCYMSDIEDTELKDVSTDEIIKEIKKYASGYYDFIYTHGENGEYGHKRHIETNRAVKKMINDKKISCRKLYTFSYVIKGISCLANKNADKFIKFNPNLLKQKKKIIRGVYGFQKNGFEDVCCADAESFDVKEIK